MSDAIEPLAVSVAEAARIEGRGRKPGGGRNAIYEQIKRGELEAFKDGGRTLIVYKSIQRRQARLPRIKPNTHSK
jgi:hypothetical protein